MSDDYDGWGEGASDILLVPSLSAQIRMLASGPLVLVGWALWNASGVACNTRFSDGAGGQFYQTSIGATNKDFQWLGDAGLRIRTELDINVVGAGPVSGAVYVRYVPRRVEREQESPQT